MGLSGRVSAYVQGDAGMMRASSDVLHTYGFYEAENLRAYFGGTVGLEWYQIDRHYALVVNGGARKTPGFAKIVGSDAGSHGSRASPSGIRFSEARGRLAPRPQGR